VDPRLKPMIEAVRRYDGYVVQSTGDGIFALFGGRMAHTDRPHLALIWDLGDGSTLTAWMGHLHGVMERTSTPVQ
jgi:class 3 adenylate cyclase